MKKGFKILLSVALSAAMTIQTALVFPTSNVQAQLASSDVEASIFTQTLELYQEGDFPAPGNSDTVPTYRSDSSDQSVPIDELLYNGMRNLQSRIDVSSYGLSLSEVYTIMTRILNTSPDLFYVSSSYRYSMSSANTVNIIIPSYNGTSDVINEQQKFYDSAMDTITNQVDSSWSDLEKIVFVHDYLCQNYEYDTSYTNYDAYSFFRDKKGVCQAYTLVFLNIMKELGIENDVATSQPMTHIWNVVKLNGKWYHIDVTWDDPVSDRFSLASHDYLLLSDTAIGSVRGSSSSYHHDWSCSYTCTDTTYDSYFWTSSNSPFQYLDSTWYYTAYNSDDGKGQLLSYNFKTSSSSLVTSLGRWSTTGGLYWTDCFSGLDVYNQKLYFNTSTELKYYIPDTNTITTVYTPETDELIYGMRIDGQTLSYTLSTLPNTAGTICTYTLEDPITTPSDVPVSSAKPSQAPVASETSSDTPTVSAKPSQAPVASETTSDTPTVSAKPSQAPVASETTSDTPTVSAKPSQAPVASETTSDTPTVSAKPSQAPVASETTSDTPTVSAKPSQAPVASETSSDTPTTAAPSRNPATESEAPSGAPASARPTDTSAAPPASSSASQNPVTTSPFPSDSPFASQNPTNTPSLKPGDLNGDGNVTLKDAQLTLKAALKIITLSPEQRLAADVNNDSNVGLQDAQLILKYALKIISSF